MAYKKFKGTNNEKVDAHVCRINLRLEPSLMKLVDELVLDRRARDLSEYVRGLLIQDALSAGKPLKDISIPAHLTEALLGGAKKLPMR